MCFFSTNAEKVRRVIDASRNDALYCSGVIAIDGNIDRCVIEGEIEFLVSIPCNEQVLVVLIIIVVITDKNCFLSYPSFPFLVP